MAHVLIYTATNKICDVVQEEFPVQSDFSWHELEGVTTADIGMLWENNQKVAPLAPPRNLETGVGKITRADPAFSTSGITPGVAFTIPTNINKSYSIEVRWTARHLNNKKVAGGTFFATFGRDDGNLVRTSADNDGVQKVTRGNFVGTQPSFDVVANGSNEIEGRATGVTGDMIWSIESITIPV